MRSSPGAGRSPSPGWRSVPSSAPSRCRRRARSTRVLRDFESAADLLAAARASCSIPVLTGPPPTYRGDPTVDGGLLEPIPYRTALREGATHVLVLRSRDAAYRAPRQGKLAERALARVHPELVPLLRECSDVYNRDAAELEGRTPGRPASRSCVRSRSRRAATWFRGSASIGAASSTASGWARTRWPPLSAARAPPARRGSRLASRHEAQPGRHTWMMSRIEMMPATWPFSITTRWRKPPFAIASAASVRSQSASANVARAVR